MRKRRSEQGQIIQFFIFIIMALGLMTAVGLQIGRIVYARGEVGKAADAAALAAASRVDLPTYRESGNIVFLPDAHGTAQDYASRNAGFLASHGISVSVSQIWIDPGSLLVYVTVSADLSSLLPGFLAHSGSYSVTGFAKARMQGNPSLYAVIRGFDCIFCPLDVDLMFPEFGRIFLQPTGCWSRLNALTGIY